MTAKVMPAFKPEWLEGIALTTEQKAKWLAALRSGLYKQCQEKLWDGGSAYCCLGVKAAAVDGERKPLGMYLYDRSLGPAGGPLQEFLVGLNDVEKWSFLQIADFIEANIPACDEVQS